MPFDSEVMDNLLPQPDFDPPNLDPQQTQLVHELEQLANAAQLQHNSASDRFDIAKYQLQQPNRFRWRKHLTVFSVAGFIGLVGTLYGWQRSAFYWIPLSLGLGVGMGRISVIVDDRRQTQGKQDWLAICEYELQQTDRRLGQAVTHYREEEETRWLMYALDIPKSDLLALHNWMADPRRTIKDSLLEAIDLVTVEFLQHPLDNTHQNLEWSRERQFRRWRHRLLNPEFQIQKDHFMGAVVAKHDFHQRHALETTAQRSKTQRNLASTTGGLGVGLAASAGLSALGSNLVNVIGASDVAIGQTLSIGGMAAAVGMSLLAANQIQHWLLKAETERRQREAKRFQDTFRLSTLILETLLKAQVSDRVQRRQAVMETQNYLKQLKRQKLEDPLLKQTTQWLQEHLRGYLQTLELRK